MQFRRRERQGIENSSALSDLAFLLIIYFIVIAGFNMNRGFLMNLPARDSVRFVLRDDLLRFELNAAGDILYQNRVVDTKAAEREIRSAIAARPNLALVLRVSPDAPWQRVVSFVELAQNLEVDSFSFTMEKPESPPTQEEP
jgi:biopolymer transport protein ExbD